MCDVIVTSCCRTEVLGTTAKASSVPSTALSRMDSTSQGQSRDLEARLDMTRDVIAAQALETSPLGATASAAVNEDDIELQVKDEDLSSQAADDVTAATGIQHPSHSSESVSSGCT